MRRKNHVKIDTYLPRLSSTSTILNLRLLMKATPQLATLLYVKTFGIRKVTTLITCFVLIWICYLGFVVWNFSSEHSPDNAECAIVLGAATWGDAPSPVFEERIIHAINLYKQGRVKKIIFTGGLGDQAILAESEVAKKYAIQSGVLQEDILIETASHTTQQNLAEAKIVMQRNAIETAMIISDPLHLKRASLMAHDLGMTATFSATTTSRYRTLKSKVLFLIREIYFINHYLLTGH